MLKTTNQLLNLRVWTTMTSLRRAFLRCTIAGGVIGATGGFWVGALLFPHPFSIWIAAPYGRTA